MIGPIVNGAALVCGSLAGALLRDRIPENLRNRMPLVFGCASMGMGAVMIVKVRFLPAAVLSLLVGYLLGELMHLDSGIQKVAGALRQVMERAVKGAPNELSHEEYLERFIAVLVLFCASGTGIFGALNEGMTGDASLLIAKAFLDLFTAVIFGATLGLPVAALALPQFAIQGALFFGASTIYPMTTPAMLADFSAVGGMIMLATGFRICGIVSFPVAGMLPALVLVMPVSALWSHYFVR